MPSPGRQTCEVHHESGVGTAWRAARAAAANLGFPPTVCEEIALVTTELATNLIKHAQGGTLTFTPLSADGRVGLEIESRDNGPGIQNIEEALTDRFSTVGSRGTGLGAVNRLMDELDIASPRGAGTQIVCRRWVRDHPASARSCPLDCGVATRPRQLGQPNGDAFVVKRWAESVLVGVIDGLGHGQFAHTAAQAARQYVEGHYDRPLGEIFHGTGRACRATRGVVMALAHFDWGAGRLALGSVGNIEARIFPRSESFHFTIRRGIIGLNAPNAVITEHCWPLDHMLVLHSDGLRTHWNWKDFPGLAERPAPALAWEFLRTLAKDDDDATVIAVKKAIP